jgi:DNA-binding NtrC family response regulator
LVRNCAVGGGFAQLAAVPTDMQVLVVETDQTILAQIVAALESSGFVVTAAAEFEHAIRLLNDNTYQGLVTAHRLGSHNGLHLVLRARHERPETIAVLTCAAPDPFLQEEAALFGAVCSVAPWNDPSILSSALRAAGVEPA